MNNIYHIDSRSALHIVFFGFIVIGRYMSLDEAIIAAENYKHMLRSIKSLNANFSPL